MVTQLPDFSDSGPGIRENRNTLIASLVLFALTLVFLVLVLKLGGRAAVLPPRWLAGLTLGAFALSDLMAVWVMALHYHALSRYSDIVRHRSSGDDLRATLYSILNEQEAARNLRYFKGQLYLLVAGAGAGVFWLFLALG